MADSYELLFKTRAELQGAVALEQQLERQRGQAIALGKDYSEIDKKLEQVRGSLKQFGESGGEAAKQLNEIGKHAHEGGSLDFLHHHIRQIRSEIHLLGVNVPEVGHLLHMAFNPYALGIGVATAGVGEFVRKLQETKKELHEISDEQVNIGGLLGKLHGLREAMDEAHVATLKDVSAVQQLLSYRKTLAELDAQESARLKEMFQHWEDIRSAQRKAFEERLAFEQAFGKKTESQAEHEKYADDRKRAQDEKDKQEAEAAAEIRRKDRNQKNAANTAEVLGPELDLERERLEAAKNNLHNHTANQQKLEKQKDDLQKEINGEKGVGGLSDKVKERFRALNKIDKETAEANPAEQIAAYFKKNRIPGMPESNLEVWAKEQVALNEERKKLGQVSGALEKSKSEEGGMKLSVASQEETFNLLKKRMDEAASAANSLKKELDELVAAEKTNKAKRDEVFRLDEEAAKDAHAREILKTEEGTMSKSAIDRAIALANKQVRTVEEDKELTDLGSRISGRKVDAKTARGMFQTAGANETVMRDFVLKMDAFTLQTKDLLGGSLFRNVVSAEAQAGRHQTVTSEQGQSIAAFANALRARGLSQSEVAQILNMMQQAHNDQNQVTSLLARMAQQMSDAASRQKAVLTPGNGS